jgi:hypothetical protein
MRPHDLKYISRTKTEGLERWIIRKGWVLITCSGTIGRVGLVSSVQDQWAASQHLLRIVPDQSKGHPGYLAAFLTTPYGQHQITAKIYGGVRSLPISPSLIFHPRQRTSALGMVTPNEEWLAMYPAVTHVTPQDFSLALVFDAGAEGILDMKPYLDFGIFSRLKGYNNFRRVRVVFDAIEWDCGIDTGGSP